MSDYYPPGPQSGGAGTDQVARDAAAAAQATANAAVSTPAELAALLPSTTIVPTNATVARSINDLEGEFLVSSSFADISAALAKAKALAPRLYNLTVNSWSAAALGWKTVRIPAGVWVFNAPVTLLSAMGLVIEGEGVDATTLLFTPTSGDFLTLGTPIHVLIRNLTLANGTTAPSGGYQQVTIHDSVAVTTARGLLFHDVSGATKWMLDNVKVEGFKDQIVPYSDVNSNCDSLLMLNCTHRWCQRVLPMDCDQILLMHSKQGRYHFVHDAVFDLIRGGHLVVDTADVIIDGEFLRISKLEDGQSPLTLDHVRMEGFVSRGAGRPKLLRVIHGNEGEIVVRDFDNMADTDATAPIVQVDDGALNVTFEHSTMKGKAILKPKPYSTVQNYGLYANLTFRGCRKPLLPTDITLTGQAGDGGSGSTYRVRYEGNNGLVPPFVYGGASGGAQAQPSGFTLQWTAAGQVRRLATAAAAGSRTLALPAQHKIKRVEVLTGPTASVGSGASVVKVFKDVAMTQQVGTDLTLAAANTLYQVSGVADQLVSAVAFSCSAGGSGDILGFIFIELELRQVIGG